MLEFLIYLFLVTGSASFIAELIWRMTHWKVKTSVVNCTIQAAENFNVKQAADKLKEDLNKVSSKL